MPLRLRRFFPYVLVAIGLVAVVTTARAWPVEAQGHRVEPGVVVVEVLGVGVLESAREVRVAFETSGRVTWLAVDEGAIVTEGDVLGTIDASDASRGLVIAESAEGVAAAAVDRARAELERAQAGASHAAAARARAATLLAGGAIHTADHEAAVERDASAQAEVKAMRSALRQAQQSRKVAAHTSELSAAQVADGQLMSPLAGLVVARTVEAGQLVTPGIPAFTIIATDAMRVRAWVDETALGQLAVGQPVRVVFRSEGDRSFAGTVKRIGREVDRQTHELLVDVAVHELPTNFAVGQRADAWIEVGRRAADASVPRGWCGTECAVVDGGRVAARPVTLGLVGRESVEVLRGLAPGEVIVAPGTPVGTRVRVVEAP